MPIKNIAEDIRDIFQVVTDKKTWVVTWGLLALISYFVKEKVLFFISLSLFFLFFITYEWKIFEEKYIYKQRKKRGYNLYKKKKN